MKKSNLKLFIESWGNTLLGFAVSLLIQYAVCWLWDLPLRLFDNLAIIGLFTVSSLLRNYGYGWLMERLHVRIPLSVAFEAVAVERKRQIEDERFSPEHDDTHEDGELALAGVSYVLNAVRPGRYVAAPPSFWPWELLWWKPQGFWRDMVRGCALIIAEMDRALRKRNKSKAGATK